MSKFVYHQHGGSIELDLIKDHKNGTVDLGRDGAVLVERCPISDSPEVGKCTLPGKAPKKPKGKQPTPEEKAKALADAQAALRIAEEALAADPTNAELAKRVDELTSAVEEIED